VVHAADATATAPTNKFDIFFIIRFLQLCWADAAIVAAKTSSKHRVAERLVRAVRTKLHDRHRRTQHLGHLEERRAASRV